MTTKFKKWSDLEASSFTKSELEGIRAEADAQIRRIRFENTKDYIFKRWAGLLKRLR